MKFLEKNVDAGLLLLRVMIAGLMLFHGIGKLMHGIEPIAQMVAGAGLPAFVAYGVYVGEIVAPLFILLGVGTRAAAGVFAVNMLVATLMVHSSQFFTLDVTGGWALELQALYFLSAAVLVFTGGGKYALSKKYLWD